MKFSKRTKKPASGNKWFTASSAGGHSNCTTDLANPFFSGATVANCVGYCWGRYFEALAQNGKLWGDQRQIFAKRINGNPPVAWNGLKKSGYWKGYLSSTPMVGSIAFYSKNSAPSKSGHVSFVEHVYSNGNVDFSNCNYTTKPLWAYQSNVNPRTGFNGYTLLGYLHPCPDKWGQTYTTTARLRLRKGAGTDTNIITVLPKGQKVKDIGYDVNNWKNVETTVDGKYYQGWVSGDYLK